MFAPLGVKLGAPRLVATAERFGFNHAPGIAGAAESTLPAASSIQGELDVGSTAIGQGQVQASALQMAIVAASIADGGSRPRPTFTPDRLLPAASVTSADVAHTVRRLMIGVVRNGTGTSAAIPGVTVAGKTGTAELKSQCTPTPNESGQSTESAAQESSSSGCVGADSQASNTDAWFASFAPALKPRIVVGVLLVKDGAGGDTAAPVAREVLEAGLQAEPLDVELRRGRLGGVVRIDDLQLQRAVVERDDLDLEQQQRALRGAVGGDRVERSAGGCWRPRCRRGRRSCWSSRARSVCSGCPACR